MPANAERDDICSRKSMRRPGVSGSLGKARLVDQMNTIRDGSRYGGVRRSSPLMTLNIAVFAPMPSASVKTAVSVKPGVFNNERTAYHESSRRSFHILVPLRRRDRRPSTGTRRYDAFDGDLAQRFAAVATHRVRLDRALSKLRIASRREARDLITAGKVRVRGRIHRDPSAEIALKPDEVTVDGQHVDRAVWHTILLNKPRGVVTTRRDPEGRRTVFDVLGAAGASLVAVGRLDMATSGLLLLTTDTRLADWLTDPANEIVRQYAVTVRGRLTDESCGTMMAGIDGLQAKSVRVRKRSERETHLIVELTEGRNREIRRLCAAVGHEVTGLKRIAFGTLQLGTLQRGEWRDVTRDEIEQMLGHRRW